MADAPERWRPVPASRLYRVPGGVFEASTGGTVRKGAQVLAGAPDADGYLRVRHGGRWFYVHVLVILAWQGEPQVRHLGDSNTDNRPEKLAWGSRRQNERDKRTRGKGAEGREGRENRRREGKGEVSPPAFSLQPVTGGAQG